MRRLSLPFCAALVFAAATSTILAPAFAETKAELVNQLLGSRAKSQLNDVRLKPWHLKLTVQLYDGAGRPSSTETIEEWTAGSNGRSVYTTPAGSITEVRRDGSLYRTAGQPVPSYLLELARREVVDPLPSAAELNAAEPDARTERFGTVVLNCIMLDQPMTSKTIPVPPLGLFLTYCTEPETGFLRFSYLSGGLAITRNRLSNFQGRSVAIDTTMNRGSAVVAKTHLVSLGEWKADPAAFATDASFTRVPAEAIRVEPAVMQANLVSAPAPVYTEFARRRQAQGTVVVRATIGDDGRVRGVHLLAAPDGELAKMALDAVSQWVYKPYLVKGKSVEVETEISVSCKP